MKKLRLTVILSGLLGATFLQAQVSVVVDTLQTRAQFQQFPIHEPGFEIDKSNGDLYYGGTDGLYRSTDGGLSWTSNPFMVSGNNRAIHYIEMNQSTGRIYVASTDGGIGFTDDYGVNWTILNSSAAYALYIDDNNTCFARVGAIFRWTDGDWNNRVNVLGKSADKIVPGELGEMYAVCESEDEIWMSRDDGMTWTLAIATSDEPKFIMPKSNNEVFFSVYNSDTFSSDTTFANPVVAQSGAALDGIKTPGGFMWMIRSSGSWIFSDDNGDNLDWIYGGAMTTLLNGVDQPSIDADGIRDQLDEYQGVLYLAETVGRIYTVQPGNVSVAENEAVQFSVYPNPAKNIVTVSSSAQLRSVTLHDLHGRILETFRPGQAADISHIASGMYLLQVEDSQGRLGQQKLVVE